MTTSMRFTTAQRAGIIAGAVASGRIPAAKAPWYQAEIAAGGARAGAAIARLLSMYAAGRPVGEPAPVSAAAAETAIWDALFGGRVAQPQAADADEPRKTAPMTEREFALLWPEPGSYDPAAFDKPLVPGLAGYVPPPKLTAPAETPGPQLDQASRGPVRANTTPGGGTLGIVEHGEIDGGAWHSHPHGHPGSEANGHEHQHVHQPGAGGSHAIGPGHSHDAPAEFTPELASRARPAPARGPRPFTLRVPAPDVAAARQAMTPPPAMPRDQADAELAAWWAAARAGR